MALVCIQLSAQQVRSKLTVSVISRVTENSVSTI